MQRDTTLASSKVGAPVLKLIVVLAQNHHLTLHIQSVPQRTTSWSLPAMAAGTSYTGRWSWKVKELMGVEIIAPSSWRWIQGCPRLRVPSESKKAKAALFPLVLAGDTASSIWSSLCPCHVPASAPHSHTDSTGRLEIRGRCAHRQCTVRLISPTGKTIWRQGDKSEWWAADGVSLRVKRVLINDMTERNMGG